ncbi:MAG: cupin domain-containing protein [Bacillota bacterium]|nr:cupin domain-containing protein [Bacillota bacterium]
MQDYIFRKEVRPGIVVHTTGAAEKIMLCRVTLAKGAQLPEHAHPHEQASFVVSGRMTFEVAGVRKTMPGRHRNRLQGKRAAQCGRRRRIGGV